jgi:hypothetical protein
MKKVAVILLVSVLIVSCKKLEKEPLGPTDIRIENLTDVSMTDVSVSTGGGEFNFGSVSALGKSEYHRFDKAYPKANISVVINGQKYKTDTAIYTWMQYLGVIKATYKIWIKSEVQKQLDMNVIMDAPLDL